MARFYTAPFHKIPHRLPEQGAAAVFAAFDAQIHEAFFAVKCGVWIEDEAVVGGVHGDVVRLGVSEGTGVRR